jgi:hypothetical protein
MIHNDVAAPQLGDETSSHSDRFHRVRRCIRPFPAAAERGRCSCVGHVPTCSHVIVGIAR